MDNKDIIALVLGAVGTTLGVVNFVRTLVADRVRLRVVPKLSFVSGDAVLSSVNDARISELLHVYGRPVTSVEVVNLSKFPVTISEVGLCEGRSIYPHRAPFFRPTLAESKPWPLRLEPREAATILSTDNHAIDYAFTKSSRAYAMTACDTIKFGKSRALTAWARRSRKRPA